MNTPLRIYVLCDIHSPDYFSMPELNPDMVDIVFTLGDIDEGTLDYIIHMSAGIPVYGVPGNHDNHQMRGVTNIDGKVIDHKGIRIAGMGGARKYKNHPHHYTESAMNRRMFMMPAADIFISHAPPWGTSQKEDPIHQGFKSFDRYIERHEPQYWLHGHLSKNLRNDMGSTKVIGVRERMPLNLELANSRMQQRLAMSVPPRQETQAIRLGALLTLFFPK